jgi:hypothetical protein
MRPSDLRTVASRALNREVRAALLNGQPVSVIMEKWCVNYEYVHALKSDIERRRRTLLGGMNAAGQQHDQSETGA